MHSRRLSLFSVLAAVVFVMGACETVQPQSVATPPTENTARSADSAPTIGAFVPDEIEAPRVALEIYEGRVEYRTGPSADWLVGFNAQPLEQGWSIRTFNYSTAVIHFSDGSRVWLDEATEIALERFIISDGGPPTGQRHARVRLVNGEIAFDIAEALSPPNTWSFVTNDGAIAIQGTQGALKRRTGIVQTDGAPALYVDFELDLIEGTATVSRVGIDPATGGEQLQLGTIAGGQGIGQTTAYCLDASFEVESQSFWQKNVENPSFTCDPSTEGAGGRDDLQTVLAEVGSDGGVLVSGESSDGASLLSGMIAADLLSVVDEELLPGAFHDIWGSVLVGGQRAEEKAYEKLDISDSGMPDHRLAAARLQALNGVALGGNDAIAAAGTGQGTFFVPDVDECIVVNFEQGDTSRPALAGELWNGEDQPPECMSGATKNANSLLQGDELGRKNFVFSSDDNSDSNVQFSSRQPRGDALAAAERPEDKHIYDANGTLVGIGLRDIVLMDSDGIPIGKAPGGVLAVDDDGNATVGSLPAVIYVVHPGGEHKLVPVKITDDGRLDIKLEQVSDYVEASEEFFAEHDGDAKVVAGALTEVFNAAAAQFDLAHESGLIDLEKGGDFSGTGDVSISESFRWDGGEITGLGDTPIDSSLSDDAEYSALAKEFNNAKRRLKELDPVLRLLDPGDEAISSIQALVLDFDGVTLVERVLFQVLAEDGQSFSHESTNGQLQLEIPPGVFQIDAHEIDSAGQPTGRVAMGQSTVAANNTVSVTLLLPPFLPQDDGETPQTGDAGDVEPGHDLIAQLQGPATVVREQVASFLVTVFNGSDGRPVSFVWDFGDGTPLLPSAALVGHTYTTVGSYLVAVEATNWRGKSLILVRHIQVLPQECATGTPNGGDPDQVMHIPTECETGSFDDRPSGMLTPVDDDESDGGIIGKAPNIDSTPPVTTIAFAGEHAFTDGTHYVTADTQIYFLATDALPVSIEYGLDGEGLRPAFPFKIAQDGVYQIGYRGTDAAGNVESTHSATVQVGTPSTWPGGAFEQIGDDASSTIVVTVLDSDGVTPAGLVRITIQSGSETRDVVASDGAAEFSSLAAGVYQVTAHELEPSHQPTGRAVGGTVLAAQNTTASISLVLPPNETSTADPALTISGAHSVKVGGSITLSATPYGFGSAAITWSSSPSDVCTVSESGVVSGLIVGECIIAAAASDGNGISATAIHVVVVSPEGDEGSPDRDGKIDEADEEHAVEEGKLEVYVDDPQGNPVANAMVVVRSPASGVSVSSLTGSDGVVIISGLEPGALTISVIPPHGSGLSEGAGSAQITAEETERIEVRLSKAESGSVTVLVVDQNGQPATSATVGVSSSDGGSRTQATAGSDGSITFDLAAGSYVIQAKLADGSGGGSGGETTVTIEAGETVTVTISLTPISRDGTKDDGRGGTKDDGGATKDGEAGGKSK